MYVNYCTRTLFIAFARYLLYFSYVNCCIYTLIIAFFARILLHIYAFCRILMFSPPQVYQMNRLRYVDKLFDNLEFGDREGLQDHSVYLFRGHIRLVDVFVTLRN
jgi:hypothetical protein